MTLEHVCWALATPTGFINLNLRYGVLRWAQDAAEELNRDSGSNLRVVELVWRELPVATAEQAPAAEVPA